MSLWELQATVAGWNSRQPKSGADAGPPPTDDEWEEARARTRRTVEKASGRKG